MTGKNSDFMRLPVAIEFDPHFEQAGRGEGAVREEGAEFRSSFARFRGSVILKHSGIRQRVLFLTQKIFTTASSMRKRPLSLAQTIVE